MTNGEFNNVFYVKLLFLTVLKNNNLKFIGLSRESNPGPLAPKARIIPLDH